MSKTRDQLLNDLQQTEKRSFIEKNAAFVCKHEAKASYDFLSKDLKPLLKQKADLTAKKHRFRIESMEAYKNDKAKAHELGLKTQETRESLDLVYSKIKIFMDSNAGTALYNASQVLASAKLALQDAINAHSKAQQDIKNRQIRLNEIRNENREFRENQRIEELVYDSFHCGLASFQKSSTGSFVL